MSTLMTSTLSVPRLETERLQLRGHSVDDFPSSTAMWADPMVTRYILERPQTQEEAWRRFLGYVGHWAVTGFGYWVIIEKQTGEFVGEAGFADYKRQIEPSLQGMPEIGWVLARRAHGKGFATEAVRAITAWGDANFRTSTRCIIAPDNAASFRVAEKCGYHEMARTKYHEHETVMLSRDCCAAKLR